MAMVLGEGQGETSNLEGAYLSGNNQRDSPNGKCNIKGEEIVAEQIERCLTFIPYYSR